MSAPDRFLVLTLRLRDRRRWLGLTQQQVVRRLADYGVTTTNKALSSLEHGAGLDVAKLPEFAAALDCTVTYLLGLTDDPHSWLPDGPLGRRSAAPDGPAAIPRPDPDVPDVRIPPAERDASKHGTDDGRPKPANSWILGPYPARSGPGDRRDDPTAP